MVSYSSKMSDTMKAACHNAEMQMAKERETLDKINYNTQSCADLDGKFSTLERKICNIEAKHAAQVKELHSQLEKTNLKLFQQSQVNERMLARVEKVVQSIEASSTDNANKLASILERIKLLENREVPSVGDIEAKIAEAAKATNDSNKLAIIRERIKALEDLEVPTIVDVDALEARIAEAIKVSDNTDMFEIIVGRIQALEDREVPLVVEDLEARLTDKSDELASILGRIQVLEDRDAPSVHISEAIKADPAHDSPCADIPIFSKSDFEDIPLSDTPPVVGRPIPTAPPIDKPEDVDDALGWFAKWRLTSTKKDFRAQLSKVCDLEDKMDYEERTHRLAGTVDQVGTDKRRREYDAEKLKLSDLRMACINAHKKYVPHLTLEEIECKMHA